MSSDLRREVHGISNSFPTREIQSWVLFLGSLVATVLVLADIYFNYSLSSREQILIDFNETIQASPTYENYLRQLAVRIGQASGNDPALADVMKSEKLTVHLDRPAVTNASPAPVTPLPDASSQTSGAPPP
jgi:hypothetical protein